jgi:hypothetical protein
VLNILRGFNERFQFMSQLFTWQKPFPSFADVCADLRLAELNMVPPAAPPSALVASSSSKAPAATCSCAFAPSSGCQGALVWRRRGGRGQGGSHAASPGGLSWPSILNPWTGSIHMWPGSTPGGLRGPPPRAGPPLSQQ